jgi:hypothetical protein
MCLNLVKGEEGYEWVYNLDFSLDYDYEKASTEPFDLTVVFTPKGSDKPSAKWTLNITLDPEKRKEEAEQAKRDSQGIMLEESRPSAMAQAASLFPYPETVNWTDIFFDYQQAMDDGCYEGGTVKYKNDYGNTVKSAYKIKWDYDGNLNWLELDGVLVYSDE